MQTSRLETVRLPISCPELAGSDDNHTIWPSCRRGVLFNLPTLYLSEQLSNLARERRVLAAEELHAE